MLLDFHSTGFDLDGDAGAVSRTGFGCSAPVEFIHDVPMDDLPVLVDRWNEEYPSSSLDDSRTSADDIVSFDDYCSEMVSIQSPAGDDDDLSSMMRAMLDDPIAYLDQVSTPDSPPAIAVAASNSPQQKIESFDRRSDEFVDPEQELGSIRLVHLLLGGAEAVVCGERDLAAAILDRLKECSARSGTTMQRLGAYFGDALHCKLHGLKLVGRASETSSLLDTVGAFHILHEICPYVKFGHFSANQAILEAVNGVQRIHIVDFDIVDGVQWPSLMQSLALREEGPPFLRITALYRPNSRGALSSTQETGKRLAAFARQFNVPFVFNQVRVEGESEMFRRSSLKFIPNEVLVVNCMIHLPHMPFHSRDAVRFFLGTMVSFQPRILTMVEEELSCSSTTFTGQFREALHHYSTLFDSLEATLASDDAMRSLVERVFFGNRIKNAVTSAVSRAPIEEEAVSGIGFQIEPVKQRWSGIAEAVGFKQLAFSSYNHCQAKLLLGLYNPGHQIQQDEDKMLLCWKSKPLIAASVWSSGNVPAEIHSI